MRPVECDRRYRQKRQRGNLSSGIRLFVSTSCDLFAIDAQDDGFQSAVAGSALKELIGTDLLLARRTQLRFDEFGEGKNLDLTPCIPIFFKTGLRFLPNRSKAPRDCQTSITRQPPGIGPTMCVSSPLTGQSASLFFALSISS